MLNIQIHQESEEETPKNRCFSIINMDISSRFALTEKLILFIPSFGRIIRKVKKEKRKYSWKQRKEKAERNGDKSLPKKGQ